MTLNEYFCGNDVAKEIFDCLREMIEAFGPVEIFVQKSQIAFRRNKALAYVWRPGKYLRGRGAPLVLTISLPFKDPSQRWKEIVEPRPGRFTHHLELHSINDIDDEVRQWVWVAWTEAA